MKIASTISVFTAALCPFFLLSAATAGTWNDHFYQATLASDWTGNRSFFQVKAGMLEGESASPLGRSPLNFVEIAVDSVECDVGCWINVVSPNLRVCTKGALLLRHTGNGGYVFALHEATQTIEVYRLSTQEILLSKDAKIELKKWYYVLVGSVTDALQPSGSVGPDLLITRETNRVVLRFLASPPYDYFVQTSSALLSHDWETIKSFRAKLQSFEAEVSDPVTNGLRFYRVEKVPCGCR